MDHNPYLEKLNKDRDSDFSPFYHSAQNCLNKSFFTPYSLNSGFPPAFSAYNSYNAPDQSCHAFPAMTQMAEDQRQWRFHEINVNH